MLPLALLFDLDGTLLEQGVRHDVLQEVAEEFAATLGPADLGAVVDGLDRALGDYWIDPDRNAQGRMGIRDARRSVVAHTLADLGKGRWTPEFCEAFATRFADRRDALLRMAPGVHQTLSRLRDRGVAMAVITNGPGDIQRAKLQRFELASFFSHFQIEGERGFGKPDPRCYLEALRALRVEAQHAWMVGDDLERDVGAPQLLGIAGIWRDRHGVGLPASSRVRPNRIIRSVSELLG